MHLEVGSERKCGNVHSSACIGYPTLCSSLWYGNAAQTDEVGGCCCVQRFEVKVFQGPGSEAKTVTVRVDVTQKQRKGYQGGYKDKRKGALYHHADSQTDKQVRPLSSLSSRPLDVMLASMDILLPAPCTQQVIRAAQHPACAWKSVPACGSVYCCHVLARLGVMHWLWQLNRQC